MEENDRRSNRQWLASFYLHCPTIKGALRSFFPSHHNLWMMDGSEFQSKINHKNNGGFPTTTNQFLSPQVPFYSRSSTIPRRRFHSNKQEQEQEQEMGRREAICSAVAIAVVFLSVTQVVKSITTTIPSDASAVESWFSQNVKPYKERSSEIDPALSAAEEGATVVKVAKDGSGDFKTVTDAIKSVPSGNKNRVIISIGGGVYTEKIKIDRTKPFITFYGSAQNMPTLTYSGTAAAYGTVDSASVIVESDYFMAVNIIFANSSPRPNGKKMGEQAVAIRISGDKAAFYNCKMVGYQDTVCDDRGRHFFKNCEITGTVDFIFGSGQSLYLNTHLYVDVKYEGFTIITANAREVESDKSGYSFVHGKVDGSGTNNTYLGRAWKSRPKVVFAYTDMSAVVISPGWSLNFRPETEKTVYFGEYQCTGSGAKSSLRAPFTKALTSEEVKPFVTLDYVDASSWLLPPPHL